MVYIEGYNGNSWYTVYQGRIRRAFVVTGGNLRDNEANEQCSQGGIACTPVWGAE